MTIRFMHKGEWVRLTVGTTGVYLNGVQLDIGMYSIVQGSERCLLCNQKVEKNEAK